MKKIYFLIVVMLHAGIALFAYAGEFAQNGVTVAGGLSGSASNRLDYPYSITLDAAGNIYIADQFNHRVQKWAPGALTGVTVAGGNGQGSAANQLNNPLGVAVDAAGNLYVVDQPNHRIQKWAPGAIAGITVAGGNGYGPGANQLANPTGIFVDAAGNIYIADTYNNRIQKWAPGAVSGVTVAGGTVEGSAPNQLNLPTSVFVDVTGDIFISDAANFRIQKWSPGASAGVTVAGGNGQGSAANQLMPRGIFVDAVENIYVADGYNRIQKWSPGALSGVTVAGGFGAGSASNQLNSPTGVFLDARGNMFVADRFNNRIQKFILFSSTGSRARGTTVAGGNGYGPTPNQLAIPNGVFVDAAGNVYIADTYNNRIQKWAPGASSGVTVAGGNGLGSAANQLDFPIDVFVDSAGNIYIAEPNNNRIQKWAPGAISGVTVAGGNGPGSLSNQLRYPTGVFVDADGNLYVADNGNDRIQKWALGAIAGVTVAGGHGTGSAASQFDTPFDMFVDLSGNIYVADAGNQRIQKWAPGASSGITIAGGNGLGSAANQINPYGVYVDAAENIYVSDNANSRIQKFSPGASIGVTVAGGNGYGTADVQLGAPVNIAVDVAGNIYVADQANNRIQKFSNVAPPLVCPENIIVTAPSCDGKATISWMEPHDTFPAVISVAKGINLTSSSLIYKGSFNGHGYYQSNDRYRWNDANQAADAVGAHLVTITSAAENDFIFKNLNQRFNYAWIGLYNTGAVGQFSWVTGEPLSYTNWYPGEPNNLFNVFNAINIVEPFVHINGWADSLCRWNDNSDNVAATFIAEFDNMSNSFRQISGPRNGSEQLLGVYNVCYERTNNMYGTKDTCCFSVTVTCNDFSATAKGLKVLASPNPTSNYFRLDISTDKHERISLQVTDMMGRIIESRASVGAGEAIQFGSGYKPGVYFAQVAQGAKKVIVKVIKQ